MIQPSSSSGLTLAAPPKAACPALSPLQFIGLIAGVSALGHDIGKAGDLLDLSGGRKSFQLGLETQKGEHFPTARHEIISAEFYKCGASVPLIAGQPLLVTVDCHLRLPGNPIDDLIVKIMSTHHGLPMWCPSNPQELRFAKRGLRGSERTKRQVDGPVTSAIYALRPLLGGEQLESRRAALAAQLHTLAKPEHVDAANVARWLRDAPEYLFCLGRLALLLGDHAASAAEQKIMEAMDPLTRDRQTAELRASGVPLAKSGPVPLADHLCHVYKTTLLAHRTLNEPFPGVTRKPAALRTMPSGTFAWQAQSWSAVMDAKLSTKDGFFGVVLAGTGAGKTQGSYRIASALRNDAPRFTLALAQGALAVQQGLEYRNDVGLRESECSIIVGWRSRELLTSAAIPNDPSEVEFELEGAAPAGISMQVFEHLSPVAQALSTAPVAVLTIDHLMAALKGSRAMFVAAMTRMATADLVIDEIDSFSTTDLHAVGRLIYLSGLFGRRVLIASASVTPIIADGFFTAYAKGYAQYQAIHNDQGESCRLFAGWFGDQLSGLADVHPVPDASAFRAWHAMRTTQICAELCRAPQRRKMGTITLSASDPEAVAQWGWDIVRAAAAKAQDVHGDFRSTIGVHGQTLSTAFIRFNLTSHAFRLAEELPSLIERAALDYPELDIRFNILTSRMDVASRQRLECLVGALTKRKSTTWPVPEGVILKKHTLFLLVTTPILEVGRDFDFDFCILEPASDASIIQCAGRVLRHRRYAHPGSANVLLLSESIRGLGPAPHRRSTANKYGEPGAGVEKGLGPKNECFWKTPQRIQGTVVADKFDVVRYADGIHAGHRISESLSPADQLDRTLQSLVLLDPASQHADIGPTALVPYLDRLPFCFEEPALLAFRYAESAAAVTLVWECNDKVTEWMEVFVKTALNPRPRNKTINGVALFAGRPMARAAFEAGLFFTLPTPSLGTRASLSQVPKNGIPFRYHPSMGFAPPG